VLVVRRRRAGSACPTCGRDIAGPGARCAVCSVASAPSRGGLRKGTSRPIEDDLSPTVLARMNVTEEYLEKTVTLRPRPILSITRGADAGQVVELSESTATSVGRAKANDLVVNDVAVSSQHCRIRPEDGRFVLHDLKSTNGTFVNERRVTSQPLAEGDVIKIGETHIQFRLDLKRS
jgi:pSer/pThr/pTyr-binding forkhead associated (FHA) protein